MSIPVMWGDRLYSCAPLVEPIPEPSRVIAYSQRDSRWSAATMGGTRQTIGRAGCAMVAAAAVLSQRRPDLTPLDVNVTLTERNGYNIVGGNEAHLAWDRLPTIYPELQWLGRESWTRPLYAGELDRIRGFIAEAPLVLWVDFYPLTAAFNTHFVLAEEWLDDDILVVDPWNGDRVGLLARYARPGQTLARAIWGYRRLVVR